MAFDVGIQPPPPQLEPDLAIASVPIQLGFPSSFARNSLHPKSGEKIKMSRRSGPKLDLKLNLSPPRANRHVETPATESPPSSCVSSELNQDESTHLYSNSSPEATSMMLVGCPRCLMYVMLAEADPRCPKCKSTVLLDVFNENPAAAVAVNKTGKR